MKAEEAELKSDKTLISVFLVLVSILLIVTLYYTIKMKR